MAKLDYSYANVSNSRNVLVTNRNKIEEYFNKYNASLNELKSNWQGSSASVSESDFNELIANYNRFMEKVNEFIVSLDYAEKQFVTAEQESKSQY